MPMENINQFSNNQFSNNMGFDPNNPMFFMPNQFGNMQNFPQMTPGK